mmetsp:Transcript_35057/g.56623  ORF Transcript_35057/g.56623 Transcript_35057/m.56623 type:complete len:240 (-) Transcript_35057:111-830(-)|eukprot:CAMPEP_0179434380 /NCGR_PEP_ID=MMETSP0799-20121207/18696_1 /TAXON_ID=46947 /ORGANISM="Geminigera cryophila, Strain CCMP2564" /LENGTH=239 /DNA_ID=CAMNT_0021213105 /DNA_START=13 /DNA_END=732 /DNA_ORIENTATION=+
MAKNFAPNYSDSAFWDNRYENGPSHAKGIFDWFPAEGVADPLITALEKAGVPKNGRILDVGCGNSSLCFQLRKAGYTRVVGVDFSSVVVEQMRNHHIKSLQKHQDGTLHFFAMDATRLSFSDSSFDAVVDKGLLDSVLAASDRVALSKRLQPNKQPDSLRLQQSEESKVTAGNALTQFSRVLKKGGIYLAVSFEDPAERLPLLKGEWHPQLAPFEKVKQTVFDEDKHWFLYSAVKSNSE